MMLLPRPRACGALIQGDMILMVRHVEPTRSYWTLPGGGLEAGETPAEAAVREMWEETGVTVKAVRLLWEGSYGHGARTSPEYCFLVVPAEEAEEGQLLALGYDPEEAHLPVHQRLLQVPETLHMTFLRAQKVWGSITDPESIGLSPDLLRLGATFEWVSDSVASNAMIASKINILRRQAPYIYFVANNDIAVSTLSLPYVNAMEKRELGRGVWLAYPDFKEETKTTVTAVLQGDILPFVHNLDNDHYCLLSLPQPIPLVQIDEIVMEEEDVAVSVHRLLADGGCLLTFIDSYVLQIVTFDMGYAKYFFTPSNTAEGSFLQ